MKHIVCVHPTGNPGSIPAFGDETTVTNAEWASMQLLKAGRYSIWQLKRDLGPDASDVLVEAAPAAAEPTPEPAPVVEVTEPEITTSEEPVVDSVPETPAAGPEVEPPTTEPETRTGTRRTRATN